MKRKQKMADNVIAPLGGMIFEEENEEDAPNFLLKST